MLGGIIEAMQKDTIDQIDAVIGNIKDVYNAATTVMEYAIVNNIATQYKHEINNLIKSLTDSATFLDLSEYLRLLNSKVVEIDNIMAIYNMPTQTTLAS